MTHWSCRTLAKAQGVSHSTVNRLWQLHNLKPHLSRTFKLSRDSKFIEKLTDVVGLYLNPPQKAIVLCVDEKSQIQALDRTQPSLPLLVLDNYGTHKTPEVQKWLKRHGRFVLHFCTSGVLWVP